MNRNEYLQHLRDALSHLDEASRDELLHDVNEHFEDGLQSGLTEDEIANRLGSPSDMAREYAESVPGKPAPAAASCNSFQDITAIRVEVEYPHVSIASAAVPAIQVVCDDPETRENARIRVYQEGATLVVEQKRPSSWLWPWRYARHQATVSITVPQAFSGPIHLATVSGSIQARQVCSEALHLSTVSGNITAQSLRAPRADIHQVSGGLELTHCQLDECRCENVSGKVQISDVVCQVARIKSVSGRVNLDGQVQQKLKLHLISGSCLIQSALCCDMDLSLTSGSCDLLLPPDAQFVLQHCAVSGSVVLGYPALSSGERGNMRYTVGSGAHTLKCSAVSGNFRVNPHQASAGVAEVEP